ncbi:MAG TPA: addiction module protein [Blastocatellia bacterium]|nr:addiction module protein [Blastocatellia bacterium]
MNLPSESRAELADLLVQGLDAGDLGPIDRLWTAEAIPRRDEARAGQMETIAGEDALRRVRDSVQIVAVMHCSREPGYWKGRATRREADADRCDHPGGNDVSRGASAVRLSVSPSSNVASDRSNRR